MSIPTRYVTWFMSVVAALVVVGSARELDRVLGELAIGVAAFVLSALLVLFSKGAKVGTMWVYALLFGGLWAGRTLFGHFVASKDAIGLPFGVTEVLYFAIAHAIIVCLVFSTFWLARLLNERI